MVHHLMAAGMVCRPRPVSVPVPRWRVPPVHGPELDCTRPAERRLCTPSARPAAGLLSRTGVLVRLAQLWACVIRVKHRVLFRAHACGGPTCQLCRRCGLQPRAAVQLPSPAASSRRKADLVLHTERVPLLLQTQTAGRANTHGLSRLVRLGRGPKPGHILRHIQHRLAHLRWAVRHGTALRAPHQQPTGGGATIVTP
jgi:hypothetical protein